MSVDGAATLSGTAEGPHIGLELLTPLYIGGVPRDAILNDQANFTGNFQGCVSRVVVQDVIVEPMRDALDKVTNRNSILNCF